MVRTCAWCHKNTTLPKVFAASSPLLEWMEQRIDSYCSENGLHREDIWGDHSDWNDVDIDIQMEAELLTYDELVVTVGRKTICKECLIEDDKIFRKYYFQEDEDDDYTLDIDNLK